MATATQADEQPTALTRVKGVIAKLFPERGFGFVLTEKGEQVFLHEHDFRRGQRVFINPTTNASKRPGARIVDVGFAVDFLVERLEERKHPRAFDVVVL